MAHQRREYLSVEDHKRVAAELYAIDKSWSKILEIVNGKVPAPVLDQLCSSGRFDKCVFRFRNDMENEMFRRHSELGPSHHNLSIYFGATE